AALALLLLAGVLDQVPRTFVPDYARLKCDYRADAEFVEQVEAVLPEGGMVYQLPQLVFPEGVGAHRMETSYELLRPYLHSRSLRWGFGAVHGRYAAAWQE